MKAKRNILIVNDDINVQEHLVDIAVEAGANPIVANDGKSGFETAKNFCGKIATVVCELDLPDIDGMSMIQQIQAHNKVLLPIVVVTNKSISFDKRIDLFRLGVREYYQKPVFRTELVDSLCRYLWGLSIL